MAWRNSQANFSHRQNLLATIMWRSPVHSIPASRVANPMHSFDRPPNGSESITIHPIVRNSIRHHQLAIWPGRDAVRTLLLYPPGCPIGIRCVGRTQEPISCISQANRNRAHDVGARKHVRLPSKDHPPRPQRKRQVRALPDLPEPSRGNAHGRPADPAFSTASSRTSVRPSSLHTARKPPTNSPSSQGAS